MGKGVVVVSKSRDIIKEDMQGLLKMFNDGYTYAKKKPDARSFAKIDLTPGKLGIIWFVSEDYTDFIKYIQQVKTYVGEITKPVFEYDLNSTDEATINRFIEHSKILANEFKLTKDQFYVRFNVASLPSLPSVSDSEIKGLFEKLASNSLPIGRLQLDFENVDLPQSKQVTLADTFSAYASKYKIAVGSCRNELFSRKNKWISCEPCVSGFAMEKVLGCKMVTVRHIAPPHEHCMCHKYIDICGTGEEFDGDMSKVRKSDTGQKLKKLTVDNSNGIAK